MTCRDIERLILERNTVGIPEARRQALEDHLRGCPECRKFEASILEIRAGLKDLDWEPLPERLDRRTQRLAREVLRGRSPAGQKSLPGRIIAALATLTVLTVIWVTASLASLGPEQTLRDLPAAARVAILFVAQNAFVLFFTPVILRAMKPRVNGHHGFSS